MSNIKWTDEERLKIVGDISTEIRDLVVSKKISPNQLLMVADRLMYLSSGSDKFLETNEDQIRRG